MKSLKKPLPSKITVPILLILVPVLLVAGFLRNSLLTAVGMVMVYLGAYGFVIFWKSKHLEKSERAMNLVAVASIACSYGFVSLAIDSGSNWQYAAAIFTMLFGVTRTINSIKKHLKHHGK